jgi:hypothetical protein
MSHSYTQPPAPLTEDVPDSMAETQTTSSYPSSTWDTDRKAIGVPKDRLPQIFDGEKPNLGARRHLTFAKLALAPPKSRTTYIARLRYYVWLRDWDSFPYDLSGNRLDSDSFGAAGAACGAWTYRTSIPYPRHRCLQDTLVT